MLDRIEAMTPGQERLKEALKEDLFSIIGIFGPTGVGKSLFALAYGIGSVSEGDIRD